jgi:acetolactate synthase-1/2/3 large subunit
MNGQEFATAVQYNLPFTTIIADNGMYGTIRMHQERAYPWRVSGTALTNPDFARLIEAYGGHGEVVSETDAFTPAFQRAVESGKPALIELRMNPEQITTRATIADLRAGKAPPKGVAKAKRTVRAQRPVPSRAGGPGKKRG